MDAVEFSTLKQYTLSEAGAIIGVSRETVRKYVDCGLIQAARIGTRRWISGTALQNYITARDEGLIDGYTIRRKH